MATTTYPVRLPEVRDPHLLPMDTADIRGSVRRALNAEVLCWVPLWQDPRGTVGALVLWARDYELGTHKVYKNTRGTFIESGTYHPFWELGNSRDQAATFARAYHEFCRRAGIVTSEEGN